ncbi:MAG: NAD-dependent epimerase/dehydratase family protein [Candidatus Omnitrophica bacterium]|nr:NAD-dependent epimerase/dehydratase family protein [Candidatus Omnitrophota bacterium]
MKDRILVTGGAGFIGSNIVESLVKLGKRVAVLDDFSSGQMEHIRPFLKHIRLCRGDIRSPKDVKTAMKDCSIVIHQAAIRSVPKSVDKPLLSHDVNTTGTLVLLNEAVRRGVKRFVYASSSSAYGDVRKFPQKETDPLRPLSPYGVSKLCAENYCYTYFDNHGLKTVSLRYFNVYGPRQNPESLYSAVVPAFIDQIRRGKVPVIDGTGKQSRDFTYVGDVVRANLLAALGPGSLGGSVFNIAAGSDYSVNTILSLIAKHMGVRVKPAHGPARRGDAMRTYADISAAKTKLKWMPKMPLDEGLKETVRWFVEKNPKRLYSPVAPDLSDRISRIILFRRDSG